MLGWMLLPKREKAEIGMLKILYRCERILEVEGASAKLGIEPAVRTQREIDDLIEIKVSCKEYLKNLEISNSSAQDAINYAARVVQFVNIYYSSIVAGRAAFTRTMGRSQTL